MVNKAWVGALVFSVLMLSGFSVTADEKKNDVESAIQAGLYRVNKGLRLEKVTPSAVSGVYLVQMGSGELLYVSGDGKYIFPGDLMAVKDGGLDNLTEKVREELVQKRLAGLDAKDMIVFPAKGEKKGVLYIFTDVDCGYCRKLHQEVSELNKKGVEVRYLAFPRGGEQAPAYARLVSAWCAKDRGAAMTTLKSGGSIPPLTCDNPVMSQYQLGISIGVRGTPAIYLEDGRSVPGYQPASALLNLMDIQ